MIQYIFYFYITLMSLHVIDTVTTYLGIKNGGIEANPLLACIIYDNMPLLLLSIKLLHTVSICVLLYFIGMYSRKLMLYVMGFIIIFYLFVILSNVYQLSLIL